jgi:putative ATP-dependent endonuclease of the OLD family
MYLTDLIIVNYRSCKEVHLELSKDEPNVLIGINDCGKSTILKAIDNLLSVKPTFSFESDGKKKVDLSNTRLSDTVLDDKLQRLELPPIEYNGGQCIILGKFRIEEDDITDELSSRISPHLLWVLENEPQNTIWYGRVFDTEKKSIKDILLTFDLVEDGIAQKLYNETDAKLRTRIKSLNISNTEIDNDNKKGRFKKIEMARAIYNKCSLTPCWNDYEIKSDRFIFPECNYLDWNVSLEQIYHFATNVINTKIQEQIAVTKDFAAEQARVAQEIVNRELKNFTGLFANDLPNVEGFKANFNLEIQYKLTDILINKSNGDGDIHLDLQGEGVKRQIWFALIKWNALNSISSEIRGKKYLWCFDEPETHLYPKAQREFFEIIKQVSASNVQTVLSTHSTVFIDRADFSTICRVELANSYTVYSKCNSIGDVFQSLQIKNSDFLFYDKFLVVEGITEKYLFPKLFELVHSKSLNSCGVQLICLEGKDKRSQNKRILDSLLTDFNKKKESVIYIFDNDVSFGKNSLTGKELGEISHFCLGRQDIEDSFGSNFWHRLVVAEIPEINISIDEIKAIIESIPNKTEISSNKKFDRKLKDLIRNKLGDDNMHLLSDRLHDKGENRVNVMLKHLTTLDKHLNN